MRLRAASGRIDITSEENTKGQNGGVREFEEPHTTPQR